MNSYFQIIRKLTEILKQSAVTYYRGVQNMSGISFSLSCNSLILFLFLQKSFANLDVKIYAKQPLTEVLPHIFTSNTFYAFRDQGLKILCLLIDVYVRSYALF